MKNQFIAAGLGIFLLAPHVTFGEAGFVECGFARMAADAPANPSGRRYAPSRKIDISHLALDVTPDFKEHSIAATATLRFKPIAMPLAELKLDGVDLRVDSVTATEKILGWQATDRQVIVTFAEPIPPEKEASVTIVYRAFPKRGLYFRTPEMGYPASDTHLWTQGESIEARHWFPCFDSPNEKFTSEITCHVPEGMTVLSNGRRVSQEKDDAGLVAVRWLQDKPHVTYLISLLAGYFKSVDGQYRDIPLSFHVPASLVDYAAESFKDTADIMAFFEKEIGVVYPWAKYDQVCVYDFTAGGMENTSITTLNDRTLHTPEYGELRSSQGLVAHELAHQWFGDLVTCKDWGNVWLNEGFATYYELLYDGHKHGRETFLYRLYQSAKHIVGEPDQTNAIVRRDYLSPNDQFSYLAYPKGGWVLQMLRSRLGADLYRRCIQTYLERHRYGNVETEDLASVVEELSGRSWDQFFDQYVYHAGQPELGVAYAWDEGSKLAKLTITQEQHVSDRVLLFNVPLPVRFKTQSHVLDRQIRVEQKSENFYFKLPEAPTSVRIDPEMTVLAKINFTPPAAMLQAQLADETDMLGRLLAVEQLGDRKDADSVGKLRHALTNDSFYGVRMAAARSLRTLKTDAAFEALLSSTQQSDARVRRAVDEAIAGFFREATRECLMGVLDREKNPDIAALAIRSLGAYHHDEIHNLLLRELQSDSFHNQLADAAIDAMRGQDDDRYVEPLHEVLRERESAFTSAGLGDGLRTLGFLARNETNKTAVREFLLARLNSPRRRVQLGAIAGLGALADPKALAALEVIAGGEKDAPATKAAEKAAADLRAGRKPSSELGSVRKEILDLQRENRDLRKDLDDVRKKLDALGTKSVSDHEDVIRSIRE